jgi:hypothetical protein
MRDVILTAFANSSQAPCDKWALKYFKEPPIVLTVPGGGGPEFRAACIRWAKTGDLFRAALKELKPEFKDVEIGRRGLCTFSVGWAFAEELLKFEAERNRLSAFLLEDGCHANDLKNWILFATRAANMEATMIMAHTLIVPPFVSTSKTNSEIFKKASEANSNAQDKPMVEEAPPEYILNAQLPTSGITIKLGASPNLPAESKTWTKDPLLDWENRGNLTRLRFSGTGRCDHRYIAWYVAERLWQWLGQSWS